MAILIDENTKVICQGFTGSQGTRKTSSGMKSASKTSRVLGFFLVFALGLVFLADTADARGGRKEIAAMKLIAVDIAEICTQALFSRKPLADIAMARGFERSKYPLGDIPASKVFKKTYRERGVSKTYMKIAITPEGACISKVTNNYQTKALWQFVDANLRARKYTGPKAIIGDSLFMAKYTLGRREITTGGNSSLSQSITLLIPE